MAKIIAKEKIDKVDYVWVQTSTTEAVRIKYVSNKDATDKGDRLNALKKRLKEIEKQLNKKLNDSTTNHIIRDNDSHYHLSRLDKKD